MEQWLKVLCDNLPESCVDFLKNQQNWSEELITLHFFGTDKLTKAKLSDVQNEIKFRCKSQWNLSLTSCKF